MALAKASVNVGNLYERNPELAGQSVKNGQFTITYDKDGYAVSGVKDGGASATSTIKTTHANDSVYHQQAYQAAQQGNWDQVGNIMNQYSQQYGQTGEQGVLDLKAANDYMAELQNEFMYNANNYYQGLYDKAYGEGAWDGGTGTGKPVFNAYSDNLLYQAALAASGGANGVAGGVSSVGSNGSASVAAANPYAGTNYHQDAINAAAAGDWAAVLAALRQRDEKTMNTGENYGRSSSDIYQELLNLYGGNRTTTTSGFTYEDAPEYYDDYQVQIDAALEQLLNRDAFSYNAATDPLYQQYQQMYEREGERAMRNTLGEVAARTGGMASTYATTAAQQANQYYLQQLADKIPELHQLAYQMYLDDINLQVQDLGLLQGASQDAYNRYRDTMADWYANRDFAYGAYRDDIADTQWQTQFDYNAERDALADSRYDTEWEYQLSRDQLADQRYDTEWAYQVAQDKAAASRSSSSGSSGGSSSSSSGNLDGLLQAMYKSGDPEAYMRTNYDKYGFSRSDFEFIESRYGQRYVNGGNDGVGSTPTTIGASLNNEDYNFTTYESAVDYLKKTVPSGASGVMTKNEWLRRKAAYQSSGVGSDEVRLNDTYADYLNDFVRYKVETSGR